MSAENRPQGGDDVVDRYLAEKDTTMPPYRWTAEDTLETDPAGLDPVEVEAGEEFEDGADAEIWGGDIPDPQGMAAALTRARRVVAVQDAPELREAKSPADVQADVESERQRRNGERALGQRVTQVRQDERRQEIEHAARLAGWERKRSESEAATEFELRRVTNPVTQLTTLRKARSWAPAVALIPAVFAVAAGAYNVGAGLTGISPGTAWINWLIEPLVTVPIVAILIAQIAGAVPAVAEAANPWASLKSNTYARIEAVLFVVAAGLNVGVHLLGSGADRAMAAVWLVVPFGLAVSMYLAPKLRADLTARFVAASQTVHASEANLGASSEPSSGPSSEPVVSTLDDQRGKKPTTSAEKKASGGVSARVHRGPAKKSVADHEKAFAAAVSAGELDPGAVSVNQVKNHLRCQWGTADQILSRYRGGRQAA